METKSYSTWSLLELKTELRKRGASLKGKKADLVERLELYDKNFNFVTPQVSPNPEPSIVTPPLEMYHDINSNSLLPPLERLHLRYYFERFNKKTGPAEKLYEARFLLFIRSAIMNDCFYIRGSVKKTMKKLYYQVDIRIDKEGSIEECHCECPAGSGTEAHCKHVGVVLFAVLHMRSNKILLTAETQTQELQSFHRPRKTFCGTPVKAENLSSRKHSKNVLFEPYPMKTINKKNYNDRIRNLILLNFNSDMPLKQMFGPANPIALSNDHNYLKFNKEQLTLQKLHLVSINRDEIELIENSTKNQNSNPLWHEYRSYRLTASNFHTICNVKSRSLQALAKQLLQKKTFTSRATAHGLINEKNALRKYCELYDLEPIQCGMFVSKDRPWLSASPDALLGEETVIEIKCPYVSRNRYISPESVSYLQIHNGNLTLKQSCPYYFQVQGQMYCAEKKFCNLVIYTYKDLKVIFLERDETFINYMLLKLDEFYTNYMKGEIINKYLYKDYYNIIKPIVHYLCFLFIILSLKLHNITHMKNILDAKAT